jgi:Mg2+/Co2+ transporter CorB
MHGAGEAAPVDLWVAVLIVTFCIALSAFFSGSETAMTAASRVRMHGLERNGDKRAKLVNRLLSSRGRLIGAMLLGNTIVNIGASAFMTNVLTGVFGDAGVIYATILMTILLLIFSEVLPKTIGINFPDRMSLIVARPAAIFVYAMTPVMIAIDAVVGGVLRLIGLRAGLGLTRHGAERGRGRGARRGRRHNSERIETRERERERDRQKNERV